MKKIDEKKKTLILRILIVAVMLAVFGVCVYLYLHFGKSLVDLLKNTDDFKSICGR